MLKIRYLQKTKFLQRTKIPTRLYSINTEKEKETKKEDIKIEEFDKKSKIAGSLLRPPTIKERIQNFAITIKDYSVMAISKLPSILWKVTVFIGKYTWIFIKNPLIIREWGSSAWVVIKHSAQHYWVGAKLFYADTKVSLGLLLRLIKGEELTRREKKQLINSVSDMFRLVPLLIFIIVPFLEFTLPIALKIFPNMLPRQFQDDSQKLIKEERMKQTVKAKIAVAKFLQDTVSLMANDLKKNRSGEIGTTAEELKEFIDKVRIGEKVTNSDIVKFAKLFSDEITLDNISRPQLVAMCRYMGLYEYGTDAILRYRLNNKIRKIKADDRLIAWEGVKSLSTEELVYACNERGMKVSLPKNLLQKQLENWIQLSLNQKVPASLLILSRAFSFTSEDVNDEEAIKEILGSLPDQVMNEISSSQETGALQMNTQKLEQLKRQEQLIAEEKISQKEQPKFKPIPEDVIVEIQEAIANASQGPFTVEKTEVEELINEHVDTISSVESPTVQTLANRVSVLLQKLEENIEKIDEKMNEGKEEFNILDKDKNGIISVEEIRDFLQGPLAKKLSNEQIELIMSHLDRDKDGQVSLKQLILELKEAKQILKNSDQ